ncbi:acyltransferase [Ahrensia kielensis]|uniref:Acyltransferase n=1 Tax=Ahrensia kielensis TaxID=76980 RepID=A0ABU9T707_9HYPH
MTTSNKYPFRGHLEAVDGLRGFASLAVLFWHYQHFYYLLPGEFIPDFQRSSQPAFLVFKSLYERGNFAVELFWLLSGFVMAHVYLSRDELNILTFAKRRFARIFPLHWLTLIVVAAAQYLSFVYLGHFQIYGNNDLFHFILNLVGAAHWGFQDGFSFNAPFWSVSVELISYIVFGVTFCIFSRLQHACVVFTGLLIFVGFRAGWGSYITLCLSYFFSGVTLWILVFGRFKILWLLHRLAAVFYFLIAGAILGGVGLSGGVETLLFSIMILMIAIVIDFHKTKPWPAALFLGKISFGIYLWHIPVQIFTLIVIKYHEIDIQIFNSIFSLAIFIGATMALSCLSFYIFERPIRSWLSSM